MDQLKNMAKPETQEKNEIIEEQNCKNTQEYKEKNNQCAHKNINYKLNKTSNDGRSYPLGSLTSERRKRYEGLIQDSLKRPRWHCYLVGAAFGAFFIGYFIIAVLRAGGVL